MSSRESDNSAAGEPAGDQAGDQERAGEQKGGWRSLFGGKKKEAVDDAGQPGPGDVTPAEATPVDTTPVDTSPVDASPVDTTGGGEGAVGSDTGKSTGNRQEDRTQDIQGEENQEDREGGFLSRMKSGLGKTRASFTTGLANILVGKKEIDEDIFEEIETQLLVADVGMEATMEIIDTLTGKVSRQELIDADALYDALKEELRKLLEPSVEQLSLGRHSPEVILMVGVNGVGKTTTIGKLARQLGQQGKSVMLAAGDTFRAAAVEQLQAWGERNDVPVIAQHTGADSASVIFDALEAAKARNMDVLIADTAGRLHNKSNLMEELKKIVRVMKKLDPEAPHEIMLVVDASTGQNALSQFREFSEAVGITGITLTKLDGTAKGGIVFALARQAQVPIRYIGIGESVEDLRPFDDKLFVDALFSE